ncbi:MAG: rRNA maturation RNase YbeY [Bacteroidota bacterium]
MAIEFSSHRTSFKLPNPKKTSAWIEKVVKTEKSKIGSLSYVFCSDNYLLRINQDYLDHDTLTDIITFDYTEPGAKSLEGEIYISIQRVRENSKKLGVDFSQELHRVMIHGVLHLLGYGDKSPKEKAEMRRMEEKYLKRY